MTKRIVFDFNGKKNAKKNAKKNLNKGLAIGAAAGTAIGAAAGLIFAPKSGKETRKDISDGVTSTAKKVSYGVKTGSTKLGEKVGEVFNEGKNKIFKKHSCCENADCSCEPETCEEAEVKEEKIDE